GDAQAPGGAAARAGADALEAAAQVVRSLATTAGVADDGGTTEGDEEAAARVTEAVRAMEEQIAADRTGGGTRPADALVVALSPLVGRIGVGTGS
ncbi:hypothetical protein, partial [Cellulomonas triticagri]|uniref:hypothetical protein n=1 Tax=Cellulomonas triticagri TaxID=2483352 RepID=UPI0013153918